MIGVVGEAGPVLVIAQSRVDISRLRPGFEELVQLGIEPLGRMSP